MSDLNAAPARLSDRKTPIQVGVIGIGFAQQVHVPAFRSHSTCQVAAICSSSLDRAQRVAERLEIPHAFGDWRELIQSPAIDAVTIAVPPFLQPSIALAALEQQKAVFCEKPLATTAKDAEILLEWATRQGVAHMVDLGFPELPAWKAAKELLDKGTIGALRHVTVAWQVETYANRMRLSSWKTTTAEGGGVLFSFGSHTLHYLEWLAGPIRRLHARLTRAPGDKRPGDSLAMMNMELASGAAVSVTLSTHAFLGNGHRLEFYGEEGTLLLTNTTADYMKGFQLFIGSRSGGSFEQAPTPELSPENAEDSRIPAVSSLASRFLDWIETGASARPNFEDGLRAQILLDAALRSDRTEAWVEAHS
ncbi:MAG: Gfo/Idh/MocA family oxidoreductase [Thermodesulfobacteriota bacterium]